MSICRCSHDEQLHAFGRNRDKQRVRMGCTAQDSGFQFCKCQEFHEAKSEEEIIMATKKATKKKGEGRTPTLAPYAEALAGKTIYMNHDGKEHAATVLTSGVIRFNDKDYTSPSSAGQAILGKNKKGKPLQVDGWRAWRFNKDGERVPLDALRGSKSPLKAEAAKPRKVKAPKPKPPRKPRAKKPSTAAKEPPTTMAERQAEAVGAA